MIKCYICNKEFKRIDNGHLYKAHKLSNSEYLNIYPDSKIISEESRKLYSVQTKKFMESLSVDERKSRTYVRTEKHKIDAVERLSKGRLKNYNKIYGRNSVRNHKISESKKEYWKTITKEQRKEKQSRNVQTYIKKIGYDEFCKTMRFRGNKGYLKNIKNGTNKIRNSFESEMLLILENENIKFIEQWCVCGWWFDCYIPEYNLLLEFDGDFWHPTKLEECKYEFQIKNYYSDIRKNDIAFKNKYALERIRLTEKNKFIDIINKYR